MNKYQKRALLFIVGFRAVHRLKRHSSLVTLFKIGTTCSGTTKRTPEHANRDVAGIQYLTSSVDDSQIQRPKSTALNRMLRITGRKWNEVYRGGMNVE